MSYPDRRSAAESPLLTDLYQLTMAYGYWKTGRHEVEAVFQLYFRSHPFKGGFTVACGLEDAVRFLESFKFQPEELDYLAGLQGNDGAPLFSREFLDYLRDLQWSCQVDAIPEGTVVFPQEPLVRVRGPLLQCQLVETALLTTINFQSLIATKAARVCLATRGDAVLEFGLRRAQGPDGGVSASRAAYIGGCAATSNVLAGYKFGIPVRGTHAHSWVMAHDSEPEAFAAYAGAMPNNVIFLVDTYDTIDGVRNAIEAARALKARGYALGGIRLDSGDLAWLSQEARRMLDGAGFPEAKILASNDLDEYTIASLEAQNARIDTWGVGTRLVTAFDQPALGGVYKITALRRPEGNWEYKLKLSEQTAKISTPGIHQVRRFRADGQSLGDLIYNITDPEPPGYELVDPLDATRRKSIPPDSEWEDLVVPIFRDGRCIYALPSLTDIRDRTAAQLDTFHEGHKRFLNPHEYPVGLSPSLHARRTQMILEARSKISGEG